MLQSRKANAANTVSTNNHHNWSHHRFIPSNTRDVFYLLEKSQQDLSVFTIAHLLNLPPTKLNKKMKRCVPLSELGHITHTIAF